MEKQEQGMTWQKAAHIATVVGVVGALIYNAQSFQQCRQLLQEQQSYFTRPVLTYEDSIIYFKAATEDGKSVDILQPDGTAEIGSPVLLNVGRGAAFEIHTRWESTNGIKFTGSAEPTMVLPGEGTQDRTCPQHLVFDIDSGNRYIIYDVFVFYKDEDGKKHWKYFEASFRCYETDKSTIKLRIKPADYGEYLEQKQERD